MANLMSGPTKAKEAALRQRGHFAAALAADSLSHEGKTSGTGYTVDDVVVGAGFSSTEYSTKRIPNGAVVNCTTYFPSPYDFSAPGIEERFTVWVGWEEYCEEIDSFTEPPGMALPEKAYGWLLLAEYEGQWFAMFHEAEDAEAFAAAQPVMGDNWPALKRGAQ